ncbi:MAG: AAA family ATPase [Candidatus Omnitrophica bacterium]|nr:AAA family ATPase [Candidatus Omnitrophota bacterium]
MTKKNIHDDELVEVSVIRKNLDQSGILNKDQAIEKEEQRTILKRWELKYFKTVHKDNFNLEFREVKSLVTQKELEERFNSRKPLGTGAEEGLQVYKKLISYNTLDFFELDIPPVEWWISGMILKSGMTMLSAEDNVGKTIFSLCMAKALTGNAETFLDRHEVKPARVLYFDFEMGPSLLQNILDKLQTQNENFFVVTAPGAIDINDNASRQAIEIVIREREPNVIIFDSVSAIFFGNENSKEEITPLLRYFDELIDKYDLSIVFLKHWRKPLAKGGGGERHSYSGSYWWSGAVDCHIGLSGRPACVSVKCHKSRGLKFTSFNAQFTPPDDLVWKFLNEFKDGCRFTEETLAELFKSFNADRVKQMDLVKKAKEEKMCSGKTLTDRIKESKLFKVEKEGKCNVIIKVSKDEK